MKPAATSRFRRERLPAASHFYGHELGKLHAAGRNHARCACPFHGGKNPTAFSINLLTGGFNCFNCGVHGSSIVDYVMLRDHVGFTMACKILGAWDDNNRVSRAEVVLFKRAREQRGALAAQKAEAERQRRIEVRDELHLMERCSDFASHRLNSVGPKGPEAEHCWMIMSITLPMIRERDAEYRRLAGIDL